MSLWSIGMISLFVVVSSWDLFVRLLEPEMNKTMLYRLLIYQEVNHAGAKIWAISWQNQQNGLCAQRRLRSAWASARVFAVRMMKARVLSYPLSAKRRLWSDWADAQADLSLRWRTGQFVGFVVSRLICCLNMSVIITAVNGPILNRLVCSVLCHVWTPGIVIIQRNVIDTSLVGNVWK